MNNIDRIILYKSDSCPVCVQQMKSLKGYKGKTKIEIYDLDAKPVPEYIKDSKGNYSMPTWVIMKKGFMDLSKRRTNKFGLLNKSQEMLPEFNNNVTWEDSVKNDWGDNYLMSGTYGRELGPGADNSILYTDSYNLHNIRGVRPGGPEDVINANNYSCNLKNGNNNQLQLGQYTDSTNSLNFGKKTKKTKNNTKNTKNTKNTNNTKKKPVPKKKPVKKTKFGKEYAKSYSNELLLLDQYAGASQSFGKKKKKKVIKEGSVITIKRKKNGSSKIKVK